MLVWHQGGADLGKYHMVLPLPHGTPRMYLQTLSNKIYCWGSHAQFVGIIVHSQLPNSLIISSAPGGYVAIKVNLLCYCSNNGGLANGSAFVMLINCLCCHSVFAGSKISQWVVPSFKVVK